MAQLNQIVQYLDGILRPWDFREGAVNGIQVDSGNQEIQSVAFAVDCGLTVVETAIRSGCGLLVVHHGLLWGQCQPLTGVIGKRITTLVHGSCSLYASHLPLDAHPELGNNISLSSFFDLTNMESAFPYDGNNIGFVGQSQSLRTLDDYVKRASTIRGTTGPMVLPFGPTEIERVGIVSGAAAELVSAAKEYNLDLFISGEPKQEAYHLAKDLGINVIFAGHYATETFGVMALKNQLENNFEVSTLFVDCETGI